MSALGSKPLDSSPPAKVVLDGHASPSRGAPHASALLNKKAKTVNLTPPSEIEPGSDLYYLIGLSGMLHDFGYNPKLRPSNLMVVRSQKDQTVIIASAVHKYIQYKSSLAVHPTWGRRELLEYVNRFNIINASSAVALAVGSDASSAAESSEPRLHVIATSHASVLFRLGAENHMARFWALEDTLVALSNLRHPWTPTQEPARIPQFDGLDADRHPDRSMTPRKPIRLARPGAKEIIESLERAYFLILEANDEAAILHCGGARFYCLFPSDSQPAVSISTLTALPSQFSDAEAHEYANAFNRVLVGVNAYMLGKAGEKRLLGIYSAVRTEGGLHPLELPWQVQRMAIAKGAYDLRARGSGSLSQLAARQDSEAGVDNLRTN